MVLVWWRHFLLIRFKTNNGFHSSHLFSFGYFPVHFTPHYQKFNENNRKRYFLWNSSISNIPLKAAYTLAFAGFLGQGHKRFPACDFVQDTMNLIH